jgi:hypothetical protein
MPVRTLLLGGFAAFALVAIAAAVPAAAVPADKVREAVDRLIAKYGEAHAARIRIGVRQVAEHWWESDGDAAAFVAFCEASFVADAAELAVAYDRLEAALEQVDGHLHEVRRELLTPLDLDTGPLSRVDRLLADVNLGAHVDEDLFATRVAFFALLNFPVHTLAERLERGPIWDRETWARSRLLDRFALRVPAAVSQEISRTLTAADEYIAGYNVALDRVVAPDGTRPFPEGLRLISHWGLRDELKSQYDLPGGRERQRLIQRVMERIVRQEIPRGVIDNAELEWRPDTNGVRPAGSDAAFAAAPREEDVRYATMLAVFRALRAVDPYAPTAPTAIARSFDLDRQIPLAQARALLVSVLDSAEVRDTAALIRRRLGRPLEPFDIWYSGFRGAARPPEAELDRAVADRFPTPAAFQAKLPDVLGALGFSAERAAFLAARIVVDPARGAGHAMGAVRRCDRAHLRTRVPAGGMDYKGYNVAMHELGHNVEQVLSLDGIDRWALAGVPANGFTEAFAMVFQQRDLEVLRLAPAGTGAGEEALSELWATNEIAGVALVDVAAWEWLYAHPEATPAALREAVLAAARQVWREHYASAFGVPESDILAVYSHMISYPLYLTDYPLGHIIAFQIAARLRAGDFGAGVERMARLGRLTPDAWMRAAVGGPVSAAPLLAAARAALEAGGRQ